MSDAHDWVARPLERTIFAPSATTRADSSPYALCALSDFQYSAALRADRVQLRIHVSLK
jgi:hypothetical protein